MSQDPKWYVMYVKARSEDLVLSRISSIARKKMGEEKYTAAFIEFFIPKTSSMTVKNGQKVEVLTVMYPGYIFAKMNMSGDITSSLRGTDGFKGFLNDGSGKPKAMTEDEYQLMVSSMSSVSIENNKKTFFMVGDIVKIKVGSFKDFEGKVMAVNQDAQKVHVNVQVFGRDVDLDLAFNEVDKVEK